MFNLALEKFLVLWLLGEIEHTDKAVICNRKICLKDILVIWCTVGSLNIFQPFFILLFLPAKSLLLFVLKLFPYDFLVLTIFCFEFVIAFDVLTLKCSDGFVQSALIIARLCNGNLNRAAFKLPELYSSAWNFCSFPLQADFQYCDSFLLKCPPAACNSLRLS